MSIPLTSQIDARPPSLAARVAGALAAATCWLAVCASPSAVAQGFDNPHGDLSVSCDACHSTAGWTPLRSTIDYDHGAAGFELDFGHQRVDCLSCHLELEFANVGSACADCHFDPHQGELGFDCEACHSPQSWDPRADLAALHDASLFPLTGAHRAVDCAACHQEDPPFEFQLTPLDCFSCHVDAYRSAELDHLELGFPTTCEDCHQTQAWQPADFTGGDFDHDAFFPLRGGHAGLDCTVCHSGGFDGTPSDCFACHQDDYQSTTDPNHAALGFPVTCENCHGTTTWEGASNVDHSTFFPLNGVHAVLDCQECHSGGFEGTPTDCASCHLDDYNATDDPNHAAQGFSTQCEDCHNESDWNDVDDINHAAFFPLRGAHTVLDCDECHAGGFGGTPTDCFSCHRDDYDATTDPNHAIEGFPTDCEACHNETEWENATVDHSFFPLTGRHGPLDCESCHAGGFEGTPTDCAACHLDDYEGTTDPDHEDAGFPLDCEVCHDTSGWPGANFNHAIWPLTGQHRNIDCVDCHADGYEGTPTDCAACHLDDYNNTNDPNHRAAGFPTTCEDCHNTSDWDDADFDHDQMYFPIYSGKHDGEWNSCADCHVQPGDFGVFECILCHEHNQADMADEHEDVGGYIWDSQACLACHPNGEAD